jgi:hypothetical protein
MNRNQTPKDNKYQFLFSGDFSDNSGIKILIEAFAEEFKNDSNISLILNCETNIISEELHYKNLSIQEYIQKYNLPETIKIKVVTEYISEEKLPYLINISDCFVYPYLWENSFINVLKVMSCEVPVILTKSEHSLEFFNDNNCFLIDSYTQEDSSEKYFIPDKTKLKKLMRFVYENPDKAKINANNAKKMVDEKFSTSLMMNTIDTCVNELKSSKIIRFNLKEKINELEAKVKHEIHNKDYIEAEQNLLELISYEESNPNYLFELAKLYYENNNFNKAFQFISKTLALKFINYHSLSLAANCLYKLGDNKTAHVFENKANTLKQKK